jgi:hypothetical protein
MSQDRTEQEREARLPVIETFDDLVQVVAQNPGLYLRYSRGPAADAKAGPSHDYEADVDLPGLSVTTITPEPWWPRPLEDWVARRVCKYAELAQEHDRYAWLMTGRIVGRGPDHEPILGDVEPFARISDKALSQAETCYGERFNVGRGSRSRPGSGV